MSMFDALNELKYWRLENSLSLHTWMVLELELVGDMGPGWWSEDTKTRKPPPAPPPAATDTIIIGNGPSGLSASAFLSGWRPFYDLRHPHPKRNIHHRLSAHPDVSLIDQDLSWVTNGEGEEEESGGTGRAYARFYDALVRPEADLGHDHPSSLRWERSSEEVAHICLGKGPPGGSWPEFSRHVYTLSLANWMNLPGVSIREWWEGKGRKGEMEEWMEDLDMDKDRIPCVLVSAYFAAYPALTGIQDHQLSHTTVTQVVGLDPAESDGYRWLVRAESSEWGNLTLRCKRLVMGTGVGVPRELGVPGERRCPDVVYTLGELETRLATATPAKLRRPVLVIGHGLTAADAAFFCLVKQLPVPVHHLFRIPARDIRSTVIGRLSSAKYPDYHMVSKLIQGKVEDDYYTPFPKTRVRGFREAEDGNGWEAEVEREGGVEVLGFSFAVISVGFQGALPEVRRDGEDVDMGLRDPLAPPDSKRNILPVQPQSYRSLYQEGLYVVGPLAGDNFVRHLVGGAMAAARDIIHS